MSTLTAEHIKGNVDLREQLFNDGATGPSHQIQVSRDRVAQLRGILFDIDVRIMRPNPLIPTFPRSPEDFYEEVARHWLSRNPVLKNAEVKCSGQGLHAILRFETPVVFHTDGERNYWDGIIKVVQAALPGDPDAPSITATTRPIGAKNSKNGASVTALKPGSPIGVDAVLALYESMRTSPFHTVMEIVGGKGPHSPCPFCQRGDSTLRPGRVVGFCYGGCGQVQLSQLYDLLLISRSEADGEGAHRDQSAQ